jgi:hypothetical protein
MKPNSPLSGDGPSPSRPVLFGPDGRELSSSQPVQSPAVPANPVQNAANPAETPTVRGFIPSIQRRLEKIHHWMEGAGISLHIVGFALVWWRKLGTLWTIAVLVAATAPAGGCAVLSYSTTHSIPDWIGDFGVRFDARDWSVHPFSLSAEAHDVTLRRDEHSEPVFTATSVEFSGSLGTLVSGLFSRGGVYNKILIHHGELRLEQSLTGDWNWHEFLEAVPTAQRRDALEGLYEIRELRVDGLKIIYTEHVPGNSGGGVIQTAQATIYIDDVNGSVTDFARAETLKDRPTGFKVKARTADGVIELQGKAALFQSHDTSSRAVVRTSLPAPGGNVPVSFDGPAFELRLYLENIGVGAFARMVPTTTIMPVKGTMRGNIEVVRSPGDAVICRSAIAFQDVEFAANPALVPAREQFDRIQQQLIGFRVSGPYDPCIGTPRPANAPDRRSGSGSGLLASLNVQATKNAPIGVRAVAAYDQQHLAGNLTSAVLADLNDQVGAMMAREVSRLLGPKSGQAMQQAFTAHGVSPDSPESSPSSGGNAVTSGVKSVGRGLKRLFGGGKSGR